MSHPTYVHPNFRLDAAVGTPVLAPPERVYPSNGTRSKRAFSFVRRFRLSWARSGVPDSSPGAGGVLRVRRHQPVHHAGGGAVFRSGVYRLQIPGDFYFRANSAI